jgi:hypothetical protein
MEVKMPEIKVEKNTLKVDKSSMLGKLLSGCQGKIIVKSPYLKGGHCEITKIRDINDPVEEVKPVEETPVKVEKPAVKVEKPKTETKAKKASEKKSK